MPRDVIGCEQGVLCGSCGYGCPIGAKQSTLRTFLEDATAAGARIVVGARARRVYVESSAAAGVDAGPVQVRAKAVVVAAGAVETPTPAPLRLDELDRRPRAPAASGDRRRALRGGDPTLGGVAAGALLRSAPVPGRRLRGQVRDGAPAPGAADGRPPVGGYGAARAADGRLAAALADRRDPRDGTPDASGSAATAKRSSRTRSAATTRAGSQQGSTARDVLAAAGARRRSSPRTGAGIIGQRASRRGLPFRRRPRLATRSTSWAPRMGASPETSAADPAGPDLGPAYATSSSPTARPFQARPASTR